MVRESVDNSEIKNKLEQEEADWNRKLQEDKDRFKSLEEEYN